MMLTLLQPIAEGVAARGVIVGNKLIRVEGMKTRIKYIAGWGLVVSLVAACASIGSPDGGPYDETPPLFLGSTPEPFALGVKSKRVTLEFDEFVKIEKAAEKVVISPPQIRQPIIKTNSKKIVVELDDSLKENTTYSIDFSDAIVDYNEGNPLGNFAFLFSTGDRIDTLAVSGTVLNASNLEPIKGILVGLHRDQADSAFTTKPFDRVSRTDADGRFVIRGIAPGSYRAYALQDANQNYMFDQKNEMIAFLDSLVVPYTEVRMHQDTTWIDSLTIDTIRIVPRVHYLPEDLVLLAFTETPTQRYLVSTERPELNRFSIFFSLGADSLPKLTPLNFPDEGAYVVQSSADYDSISSGSICTAEDSAQISGLFYRLKHYNEGIFLDTQVIKCVTFAFQFCNDTFCASAICNLFIQMLRDLVK